jgi:hypothetical protein
VVLKSEELSEEKKKPVVAEKAEVMPGKIICVAKRTPLITQQFFLWLRELNLTFNIELVLTKF